VWWSIQLLSDLQGDTWFRADSPTRFTQKLSKEVKYCPHLTKHKFKVISFYIQFNRILEPNLTHLLLRGGKCMPWTFVSGKSHFVMIPLPESIGRSLFFL